MGGGRLSRMALFGAVCAGLVACSIAFGGSGSAGETVAPIAAPGWRIPPGHARRNLALAERQEAEIRRAAAGFLSAFLRYEVGDISPRIWAQLEATSTADFAGKLRSARRPAPTGVRVPPRARLRHIHVALVAGVGHRAVVSGSARRGGTSEEFAFVFARRAGRWVASGPGQ